MWIRLLLKPHWELVCARGSNLVARSPMTFGSETDNKTQWLMSAEYGCPLKSGQWQAVGQPNRKKIWKNGYKWLYKHETFLGNNGNISCQEMWQLLSCKHNLFNKNQLGSLFMLPKFWYRYRNHTDTISVWYRYHNPTKTGIELSRIRERNKI